MKGERLGRKKRAGYGLGIINKRSKILRNDRGGNSAVYRKGETKDLILKKMNTLSTTAHLIMI